jgi:hypothetical protein
MAAAQSTPAAARNQNRPLVPSACQSIVISDLAVGTGQEQFPAASSGILSKPRILASPVPFAM